MFFSSPCFSKDECELTDEYKALRSEVSKIVFGNNNSYGQCVNTASKNEYFKALSICVKKGEGKNIAGGCPHIVGRGKYVNEADISHCKVFYFEPTKEMAIELLDQRSELNKVAKCK